MLNILKYELKMHIKSIIIWVISIVAVIYMMMAFYPTFGKDAALVEKLMANYPEEMLKAFGMSSGLGLSTVLGYLAFSYVFVQLCLAIQASNYGFSILSVEEREFTADFLMSKPVSRTNILHAKFIAATVAVVVTNIATWLGTFSAIEIFKSEAAYDAGKVVLLLALTLLFQLFFLTFSMAISVLVKKVRSVLTFSLSLGFGTYIINAVRAIVGGELLGYLSPFYHFDPNSILDSGSADTKMMFINIVIIILSVITTYSLYVKRDIHSL
ncbi:ABC transporter permease subunit [Alkalibacter mobilis]|uniref:ABC transporter permease subunit n=1 Tax=Alkalibacter mobilis TaxID=2787712 RepID=UPI00189F66FD|nr:ABC transporter permease subunit [Alkalibacter mobilis]MBF7097280.1 ABC transporter permease subunit [Alkalibacter mobilis]